MTDMTEEENEVVILCDLHQVQMDKINLTNLVYLYVNDNINVTMPNDMICPNLKYFECVCNKNVSLSNNIHCPLLESFYCASNNLCSLPENMSLPNLSTFHIDYNNLEVLPIMNFPKLKNFNCSHNKLTHLPAMDIFPELSELDFCNNLIKIVPLNIMNCKKLIKLRYIDYGEDLSFCIVPIVPPQIKRFYNCIINSKKNKSNEETFDETVLNKNVYDAIIKMTTREDIEEYNSSSFRLQQRVVLAMIYYDKNIKCYDKLKEYIEDKTVNTNIFLNFEEVLWYVLNIIQKDFNETNQIRIKQALNKEMVKSSSETLAGRLTALVTCISQILV